MTALMLAAGHPLVHVNATLNTVATLLLILGLVMAKRGNESAHQTAMFAAFWVSVAFLGCYLYYHFVIQLQQPFGGQGGLRYVYFAVLISHILLAMTVPFLAAGAIVLGMRARGQWLPNHLRYDNADSRQAFAATSRSLHRTLVKVAFPVWLYVSVTGVLVYLMLYHWFPAA